VVGDGDHPHQELIVSGLVMFVRGIATIGSGFIGAAVATAGESRGLQKSEYGAGKYLPLILAVGTFAGASSIGALGFLRKAKHVGIKSSSGERALLISERALLMPEPAVLTAN